MAAPPASSAKQGLGLFRWRRGIVVGMGTFGQGSVGPLQLLTGKELDFWRAIKAEMSKVLGREATEEEVFEYCDRESKAAMAPHEVAWTDELPGEDEPG